MGTSSNPWILGLSCSHNGSACLLHGDKIVAAVQDERLLRFKRQDTEARWTTHCINYCLEAGGIDAKALDLVVCSETRGLPPGNDAVPEEDVYLNETLRVGHFNVPVMTITHHHAHAVSAFAMSGFGDAAILVVDGSGSLFEHLPPAEQAVVLNADPRGDDLEWLSYYEGDGTTVTPVSKQVACAGCFRDDGRFASLGNMYGVVGWHLFRDYFEGPGKVMGLAPYGQPTVPISEWLTVRQDGVIEFRPDAVNRVGLSCSWPDDFQQCANLAASVQQALEHALVQTVARLRARSASHHLCYAGGVALNSVANERLVRDGGFERVFIVPAAEDSGVAVGAAYYGLWQLTGQNRCRPLRRDAMGRTYSAHEIDRAIAAVPALHCRTTSHPADEVAQLLCEGRTVGWFDGGSELGPRALGQRTILADPRSREMKDRLNARIKHREAFRPFAPVVLEEHACEWFDVPAGLCESPFMLRVWPFRAGRAALVPAVAHVDNSARVQTVTRETNPPLHDVVSAFYRRTGIPMLLNTSFNVAGEPIVETPENALWCLLSTGLDYCAFPGRLVSKAPAFRSILDFRPRLAATSITLNMPVVEGQLGGGPDGALERIARLRNLLKPFAAEAIHDKRARYQERHGATHWMIHATVKNRWGDAAVLLADDHWAMIKLIDGHRDGHAMLSLLDGWSEARVIATLLALNAASVIRLVAAHPRESSLDVLTARAATADVELVP